MAFAVYANTFANNFVWDDHVLIEGKPAMRYASAFFDLLRSPVGSVGAPKNFFRPLSDLTLWADLHLFGFRPAAFHATNVAIHIAASVWFLRLAAVLLGGPTAGLFAALIFAVHPVGTEGVAWISARAYPIEALLVVACLHLFVISRKEARPGGRWIAPLLAFLAPFAVEQAIVIPALVFLVDRFLPIEPRNSRTPLARSLARAAPFATAIAVFLAVRTVVIPPRIQPAWTGLGMRMAVMTEVLVQTLALVCAPFHQSIVWNVRPVTSLLDAPFAASAGILAGVGLVAWFGRRRWPAFALGAGWYFLALVPYLNLVPIYFPMADRWLHLSLAGFALAVAGSALRPGLSARWRAASMVGLAALIAMYGGLAVRRNEIWRDDFTLFSRTVADLPTPRPPSMTTNMEVIARCGLATEWTARKQPERALEVLRPLLATVPPEGVLAYHVAEAERMLQRTEEAAVHYQRAMLALPTWPVPYVRLAELRAESDDWTRAALGYQTAVNLQPKEVLWRLRYGEILLHLGKVKEAAAQASAALAIDPASTKAMSLQNACTRPLSFPTQSPVPPQRPSKGSFETPRQRG